MSNELVQKKLEAFRALVEEASLVVQKETSTSGGGYHITVADGKYEHNVIISQKGKLSVQGKESALKTTLNTLILQIVAQSASPVTTVSPHTLGKVQQESQALSVVPKDSPQVDQHVLA